MKCLIKGKRTGKGNVMEKEYVSIVLPTYNREKKLGKAIESVLKQSYSYFELLVIDDGSTDGTEQVVNSYKDERLQYHKLPQNGGQSKARNYGLQLAKYDYIAFEDSDDLWHPKKLERQMQAMAAAEESAGFCYHKLKYDMGNGRYFIMPDEKVILEKKNGDIYAQLLWDNLIGMPTLLMKRECLESIGYMDEQMNCLEDYDFALRLAKKYQAVFVDEVLLDAEFSTTGVSGNSYQYLIASCILIQKYKKDYLVTETLNHRIEIILRDAAELGLKEQIIQLLEKVLQM